MVEAETHGPLREVTIEAKVIREDGTEEELGVVSSWKREDNGVGPFGRLAKKAREAWRRSS